jgi:hypothetical protein
VAPQDTTRLQVKPGERRESLTLSFEVLNAVTAPEEHPTIEIDVRAPTGPAQGTTGRSGGRR